MAGKSYQASDQDREAVALMVGYGIPLDEIRKVVINPATGKAVSKATLTRHYRKEIEQGFAKANAKVAESLFLQATGQPEVVVDGKVVQKERSPNTSAAIWWTKARMGWKASGEADDTKDKPASKRAGNKKGKDTEAAKQGEVVIYLPDNGRDPAAGGTAGELPRQSG